MRQGQGSAPIAYWIGSAASQEYSYSGLEFDWVSVYWYSTRSYGRCQACPALVFCEYSLDSSSRRHAATVTWSLQSTATRMKKLLCHTVAKITKPTITCGMLAVTKSHGVR